MLVVFEHIHRLHRLKAEKDGEQAMSSPLNLPRSSFAVAVAAKNQSFHIQSNIYVDLDELCLSLALTPEAFRECFDFRALAYRQLN